MAWWARVNPRFRDYAEEFVMRWSDPQGWGRQEEPVDAHRGTRIDSVLDLDTGASPGVWTAELLLRGDRVGRFRIPVVPRRR